MGARSQLASIKVSSRLLEEARMEAAIMNRSIGGQLEHWATIGRSLEGALGLDRVRAALAGHFDPGQLTPDERRYYYEQLDDALMAPSEDEIKRMAALGAEPGAVGYDASGQLVKVGADGKHVAVPE
ncbi:TA system antitoxin ParD family protein [Ancylobacter oerskovii]|uniref:ParD-like antitoxin of type II ParDE toxin-antitoxin system n=2 Tax=Ancylobacter oerskovii TaxID=459519 RepID=A0ABW4Z5M8_9HYPH|nr:hypothetical protein [Ancylobacter oerskovii]